MSDSSIFTILASDLKLGARIAAGANGTTLYKADLQQGLQTFEVYPGPRGLLCELLLNST